MKNLLYFIATIALFSCNETNTTNQNSVEQTTEKLVQTPDNKAEKKTPPATEKKPAMDSQILRGTFIYVADAANFVECETNKKYNVAGEAYIDMERTYLKKRTKDFEKIYVEVKGAFKMAEGMEEGTMRPTLFATELINMDPAKSCN